MAPEFYDNLKCHKSWTRLLFQFIFDKRYSLFSRVERMKRAGENAAAAVYDRRNEMPNDAEIGAQRAPLQVALSE